MTRRPALEATCRVFYGFDIVIILAMAEIQWMFICCWGHPIQDEGSLEKSKAM